LHTDPKDRTETDVETLHKWLAGMKIPLFHEIGLEASKDLCRHCNYEKIPASNTVFRQGDKADKLYIIIRGSVSLYVVNDHADAEYPDPKLHTIKALKAAMDNIVNTPSIQKMQIEKLLTSSGLPKAGPPSPVRQSLKIDATKAAQHKDPLPPVNETAEQRRIRVTTNPSSPKINKARMSLDASRAAPEELFVGLIRAGGPKTSFGELGLIADTTRSATIRTDLQDCEFVTIDKFAFDKILKSQLHELIDAKVKEMKRFRLFTNMSDTHLTKISLHLEAKHFAPNMLIAKEGNPATHVYFILKGTAEETKVAEIDPIADNKRNSLRVRQVAAYERVKLLETGSVFGAAEALVDPPKPFPHGLRSVTECEIWSIERGDLMRRARIDLDDDLTSDADSKHQ
jgi:CRP-like cAMP-binding protein